MYHSQVQHRESTALARRSEIREGARDALNLKSAQCNTQLVCSTLFLACAFALVVEGVPPDRSTLSSGLEFSAKMYENTLCAYAALQGTAVGALMASIWCGYSVMRKLGKYKIRGWARQSLRRGSSRDPVDAFDQFYENRCRWLGKASSHLLLLGTASLMGATVLLLVMRHHLLYVFDAGMWGFLTCLGVFVAALGYAELIWFSDDDVESDDHELEIMETFAVLAGVPVAEAARTKVCASKISGDSLIGAMETVADEASSPSSSLSLSSTIRELQTMTRCPAFRTTVSRSVSDEDWLTKLRVNAMEGATDGQMTYRRFKDLWLQVNLMMESLATSAELHVSVANRQRVEEESMSQIAQNTLLRAGEDHQDGQGIPCVGFSTQASTQQQHKQLTELYAQHLAFLETANTEGGKGSIRAADDEAADVAVEMMRRRLQEPYRGRPVHCVDDCVPQLGEPRASRGLSQSGCGGESWSECEAETADDMSEGDWDKHQPMDLGASDQGLRGVRMGEL